MFDRRRFSAIAFFSSLIAMSASPERGRRKVRAAPGFDPKVSALQVSAAIEPRQERPADEHARFGGRRPAVEHRPRRLGDEPDAACAIERRRSPRADRRVKRAGIPDRTAAPRLGRGLGALGQRQSSPGRAIGRCQRQRECRGRFDFRRRRRLGLDRRPRFVDRRIRGVCASVISRRILFEPSPPAGEAARACRPASTVDRVSGRRATRLAWSAQAGERFARSSSTPRSEIARPTSTPRGLNRSRPPRRLYPPLTPLRILPRSPGATRDSAAKKKIRDSRDSRGWTTR